MYRRRRRCPAPNHFVAPHEPLPVGYADNGKLAICGRRAPVHSDLVAIGEHHLARYEIVREHEGILVQLLVVTWLDGPAAPPLEKRPAAELKETRGRVPLCLSNLMRSI